MTSEDVASVTPPICVVEAGVNEIEPPVTLMPPVELTMTPPNCAVEAAERLIVTEGPTPPPVRPVPTVMLEMVPVPGGATLRVPSAAIVTFAPALTPPILEPCGGSKESVPATVIEPPVVDPFVESPGPAVTDVKVPPRADATFITPY
jgi:hypothetical protein